MRAFFFLHFCMRVFVGVRINMFDSAAVADLSPSGPKIETYFLQSDAAVKLISHWNLHLRNKLLSLHTHFYAFHRPTVCKISPCRTHCSNRNPKLRTVCSPWNVQPSCRVRALLSVFALSRTRTATSKPDQSPEPLDASDHSKTLCKEPCINFGPTGNS